MVTEVSNSDTFFVRTLMTPAIATMLGWWFWWPQIVSTKTIKSPPPQRDPEPEPSTAPMPTEI
jgi:uncharacterized membrane protein YdfJ with MMPL/SSD domain